MPRFKGVPVDGEVKPRFKGAPVAEPQHPEFDASNIPGYNPETGLVETNSKANSALWGAANTAGSAFGDEIAAGLISAIEQLPGRTGASYSDVKADLSRMEESAAQDNPKSYLGGQVGGGLAAAVATGGRSFLDDAASLGGRVAGGALTGGAYGSAHGAGSGDGIQDRIVRALQEGGLGAFVGGAFPVVAQGAASLYRRGADWLAGRSAAQSAGTSPETLRMLREVMEADGTRGPQGMANMARAGQDAMLADAGPNARAVLDTAIQRGGPGAVAAREAIEDRTARAGQAVTGALDSALGQPQGVDAARNAIRTSSAAARGSAYDDAYAAAIDYAAPQGQALENLIRTRVPGRVISDANALMRLEGNQSQQILARIADDGAVTFERMPDVRQIDYITRALNQAAESGEGAGALGGQTPLGRAYRGLSREIRDTLREAVPEYGRALETAADPIRRSQAVEFGARLLSPSTTRDQVDQFATGLTGPERDALAQGIRSRIDDVMANVTRTVQDGNTDAREAVKALKEFSSRAAREKITAAIGEERAAPLFAELDRAATSFDLRASVAENSKTYARQATDRRIGEITKPGAVGTLAQGEPVNAAKRVVQALTGQTPERLTRRENEIYSEIARVLTRPGGQALFNAVDQLGNQDTATRLMSERIVRALGGPGAVYPTTALSGNILQDLRRR